MGFKHSVETDAREVVLLLPGMTLNRTLFPDLGLPTLDLDFARMPPRTASGVAPTMDAYVDALDTFLDGRAPLWDRPIRIVVGHSFGGMLALAWLLRHRCAGSADIAGLALIAASAGPLFDRVRLRVGSALGREWRVPLAPLLPIWNTASITRAMKRLTTGGLSGRAQDFRRLRRRSDAAIDLAGWRNTDWDAMRAYRCALDGYDVRARLPEVQIPTVVLHGTRDSLFSVDEGRRLAAGLPDAELRIVPGAGHGLPLTHGAAVVRAVREVAQREIGSRKWRA